MGFVVPEKYFLHAIPGILLKYMHQTLFNPPMETLIKAIENDQLEGFPFMKTKMVRKYLAPSLATVKIYALTQTGIHVEPNIKVSSIRGNPQDSHIH